MVQLAVRKARANDEDITPYEPPFLYRAPPGFGQRRPPWRPRGPRKKR